MRSRVVLAIVFVWTAAVVAQPPAAPGALVDAFVHAWNTHHGPAFGRLYADDADWVMVSGDRLTGRRAIEEALTREHATWARTTTLKASDVRVRDLDRRRAFVMFKWEIVSDAERAARQIRGSTVLVVERRREGWIIVAGQAAAAPAPR